MSEGIKLGQPIEPPHATGIDAAQRPYADALDAALHRLWALGRNLIVAWTSRADGMAVLVVPHYKISEVQGLAPAGEDAFAVSTLIEDVLAGPKRVSDARLQELALFFGYRAQAVDLGFDPAAKLSAQVVDTLVKRYGITYCEDRAVALFDIVGFSRLAPLDQVTQLNSLSYSVNAAYAKMLGKRIDISFARTTTGDGFYVWNRDSSIQANVNLYHFMHLVLADNAIARRKARRKEIVPELRTCFHVGGHYEFYQSEGLSPTVYSYIVGDVTIALARMCENALPNQVLVGDFTVPMTDEDTGETARIDTIEFIHRTQMTLPRLQGLKVSDDGIEQIKCYLTGARTAAGNGEDGSYAVSRFRITDKHGFRRHVYNAKVNIYRSRGEPILLGLQHHDLARFPHETQDLVEA